MPFGQRRNHKSMNRQTRKLRKTVFDSLNTIEQSVIKSAKGWDKKATSIPIDLFNIVLDKAKWDVKQKNKVARDYAMNYNAMIGFLGSQAVKSANQFGTDSIPLKEVHRYIEVIKESFDKGINDKAG